MAAAVTAQEAAALAAVDEASVGAMLTDLIRVPSVTGTAAESELQHLLADRLDRLGLDVDLWSMDLPALRADPEFPGGEAPRGGRRGDWWRYRREAATGRPSSCRVMSTSCRRVISGNGRAAIPSPRTWKGTWCTGVARAT